MDFSTIKTALVLAPHPDDGEFGCGATLRRLSDAGVETWYAAFSPCIKSLPEGSEKDRLFKELVNSAELMGIAADHLRTFEFEVREFERDRQEILETMVRLRKEVKPDLVFMPNATDIHQDHHTIYEEGVRAFKHTRMLGYELPWNNLVVRHDCHVRLNEEHLNAKVAAVQCYESQRFRIYSDETFLKGLSRVRGLQIGVDYAEAFQTIRWII